MEFNIMLNSDLIVTQLESAVLRPKIQTRPKKYYSNSLYDIMWQSKPWPKPITMHHRSHKLFNRKYNTFII